MDQVVGQALATFKRLKQKQEESLKAREASLLAKAIGATADA